MSNKITINILLNGEVIGIINSIHNFNPASSLGRLAGEANDIAFAWEKVLQLKKALHSCNCNRCDISEFNLSILDLIQDKYILTLSIDNGSVIDKYRVRFHFLNGSCLYNGVMTAVKAYIYMVF